MPHYSLNFCPSLQAYGAMQCVVGSIDTDVYLYLWLERAIGMHSLQMCTCAEDSFMSDRPWLFDAILVLTVSQSLLLH